MATPPEDGGPMPQTSRSGRLCRPASAPPPRRLQGLARSTPRLETPGTAATMSSANGPAVEGACPLRRQCLEALRIAGVAQDAARRGGTPRAGSSHGRLVRGETLLVLVDHLRQERRHGSRCGRDRATACGPSAYAPLDQPGRARHSDGAPTDHRRAEGQQLLFKSRKSVGLAADGAFAAVEGRQSPARGVLVEAKGSDPRPECCGSTSLREELDRDRRIDRTPAAREDVGTGLHGERVLRRDHP